MQQIVISFSIPVPQLIYTWGVFGMGMLVHLLQRLYEGLYKLFTPLVWLTVRMESSASKAWQWLTLPRPRSYPLILSPELWLVLLGMGFVYVPRWIEARRYETPIATLAIENTVGESFQTLQVPQRILIPDLGVDLSTQAATVSGNNWQLFEDAASWLSTSGQPGQIGNTVLYAHNRPQLFAPLYNLKPGSEIYILSNDSWFSYVVEEIKYVSATALEELAPTEDARLTLYTCTNFWDPWQQRLIVKGRLQTFGMANRIPTEVEKNTE